MKICDLNPFIRHANVHTLLSGNFASSCDSRLIYVMEGECKILIAENEYKISKDTLMLWQAGTNYYFQIQDDVDLLVINFDYTQKHNDITERIPPMSADGFNRDSITERVFFKDCEQFNQPLVLENMHFLKKKLLKIVEKFNRVSLYKNEMSSAILKEILIEIASTSLYEDTKALHKMSAVMEYLNENFDHAITNKDFGKLTGYHPHYINRLMLKHSGITLRQQLINVRLDAAKEMLVQSDIPISEISEKCGFNTSAYFSNHFKAKIGMSPSEYRRKFQNVL